MQRGCCSTGAIARNKAPWPGVAVCEPCARAAMMASADSAATTVTVFHPILHPIIIGSRPRCGGVDRLAHTRISPAAADISDRIVDFGIARALDLCQQGGSRHDHS